MLVVFRNGGSGGNVCRRTYDTNTIISSYAEIHPRIFLSESVPVDYNFLAMKVAGFHVLMARVLQAIRSLP